MGEWLYITSFSPAIIIKLHGGFADGDPLHIPVREVDVFKFRATPSAFNRGMVIWLRRISKRMTFKIASNTG